MTSGYGGNRRTMGLTVQVDNLGEIGAKKPDVTGKPAKEYDAVRKAVSYDLVIHWTKLPPPARSRDYLFSVEPIVLPGGPVRVNVIGSNRGKKKFEVDCVDVLDPLGPLRYKDARYLCDMIGMALDAIIGPERFTKLITNDLLGGVEILEGSRD